LIETVTSNGAPIPFASPYFTSMQETDLGIGDEELRARYWADGYILLREFLPRNRVRTLGQQYLRQHAVAPRPLPPHGVAGHPAYDFVRTAEFRSFVDQPGGAH